MITKKFAVTALLFALLFAAGVALGQTATANHTGYTNMYSNSYLPACQTGAGYGGGNDYVCREDDSISSYYMQTSLLPVARDSIRNYLTTRDGTVDLDFSYQNPPNYDDGGEGTTFETDIIFQQDDLPGSIKGATWCNARENDLRCDQHYVAFDSANPSKHVICHESGHAFGLKHGSAGNPTGTSDTAEFLKCMITPIPPVPSDYEYLGSHNVGEINDVY